MNVESERWETDFNPKEHKKIEHKLKALFVQSVYGKFFKTAHNTSVFMTVLAVLGMEWKI